MSNSLLDQPVSCRNCSMVMRKQAAFMVITLSRVFYYCGTCFPIIQQYRKVIRLKPHDDVVDPKPIASSMRMIRTD